MQKAKARDEKESGAMIKNETAEVSSHLPAPAQSENLPKLEASAPAQDQTNGVRVRVPDVCSSTARFINGHLRPRSLPYAYTSKY